MKHRPFRHATQYAVTLRTRAGATPATVKNVHPYGVRLEFEPGEVDLFSGVALEFLDYGVGGRVVWIYHRDVGIRFDERLPDEVSSIIARRIGGAAAEEKLKRLPRVRPLNQIDAHLGE